MNVIMQVSLFSADIEALSGFYRDVFDLEENVGLRSEIFRGYNAGQVMIGFSALEAYEMLGLDPRAKGDGDQTAFTFSVDSKTDVETMVETAKAKGGTVMKEPFDTYYGWYLAVLRDPDGNAFRIACTNP